MTLYEFDSYSSIRNQMFRPLDSWSISPATWIVDADVYLGSNQRLSELDVVHHAVTAVMS